MDTTKDPLIQYYTNKVTNALSTLPNNEYAAIKIKYGNAFLLFHEPIHITRARLYIQGKLAYDCTPLQHSKEIAMITPKLATLWNIPQTTPLYAVPLGHIMYPLSAPLKIHITYTPPDDFPVYEEIDPAHLRFIL